MKNLIIHTHLNPQSFSKAISNEIESVLKADDQEFKAIDLYAENYNPIMQYPDIAYGFMGEAAPQDTEKLQKEIAWADRLIFVFPLWWGQMPAMLKGFIDRTFTHGFAFKYNENGAEGLLKGKSSHLFVNVGNPEDYFNSSGIKESFKTLITKSVFGFCGMETEFTFFTSVTTGSQQLREGYLNKIKDIL